MSECGGGVKLMQGVANVEEDVSCIFVGRVKSFSQKSGWGFIQLYPNELDDESGCRDVFFHRADVSKAGNCELRPGTLVNCQVLCTGKGEKACQIVLVEESSNEGTVASLMSVMMVLGASDDTLSHSPYGCKLSAVSCSSKPVSLPAALYSLRTTRNHTTWRCSECTMQNSVQSIRRIFVTCASCNLMHQVQSWVCACSQSNEPCARHCSLCNLPYADACHVLYVQPEQICLDEKLGEQPAESQKPLPAGRRIARSRWQANKTGWSHPSIEAPAASSWCQDNSTGPVPDRRMGEARCETLAEKCRARLMWAHSRLLGKAAVDSKEDILSKEWIYQFCENVCSTKHGLLCPMKGCTAFVPNPCVDMEDPDVSLMYEAIGMVLALAVATQVPLQPAFPMWMARSLLGYPTTMQDLKEFNVQVWHRADTVQKHPDVESLHMTFQENIKRYGVTKHFEAADELEVTESNKQKYGAWLKDIYLSKSVEAQMKQIKHGFFYALMGDHMLQSLTPTELSNVLNARSISG